ncbi:MAG: hypothetical protein K0R50_4333 [Eubacterium sp.]|nr:hypothetical protein [Eubacterium sp.]
MVYLISNTDEVLFLNIPGATHYVHWSNADIVIDKIRELIRNSKNI